MTKEEYTRYCITEEGKEYLMELRAKKESDNEDELDMEEEIEFEDLRLLDNDEAYDLWKETRDE